MSNNLENDIKKAKTRISIISLFKEYYPDIFSKSIRQYSGYYMACCPFHEDEHPSMRINLETNTYKCFACGEFGDAITLIRKKFNLTYKEAVAKLLAEANETSTNAEILEMIEVYKKDIAEPLYKKYGLIFNPQEIKLKNAVEKNIIIEQMFNLSLCFLNGDYHFVDEENKEALKEENKEREKAIEYLKSRGVNCKDVRVGYLPVLREEILVQDLNEAALSLGFSLKSVSIFNRRILFPLQDENGHFCGFTARAITEETEKYGKYVTLKFSPTIAKSKSNSISIYVASTMDLFLGNVKEKKTVIVTEGAFDVLGFFQAGIQNVFSSLGVGTDLAPIILKILQQNLGNLNYIVIAYDSDEAGRKAALHHKEKLEETLKNLGLSKEIQVKIVHPEGCKDFAEYFLKLSKTKDDFINLYKKQKDLQPYKGL